MRVMIWSVQKRRQWLLLIVCIAVGALLLLFPQAAQTGIKRGLAVCGQLLIPSLFPFLVLSGFFIRSGLAHGIGRRAAPLMHALFGFSGNAATAMILSMLGGYPAGANAVAELLERGDIPPAEGRRLLRCCVNAGPAFIIGGVGVGMLGSVKAGVLLLIAHLLSSVLVSLTERETAQRSALLSTPAASVGAAVVDSVHSAASALISMCGFVLLSSGLLSLTDALGAANLTNPLWRCLIACVTEVTTGCVEAAGMGTAAPFWLGAALGFGGLSVHGQILSRTAAHRLIDGGFFRARLLHALLGGCLSLLFFWWWHPTPAAVSASSALSSFSADNPAIGMTGLVALILMCVLFLYTLPRTTEQNA